MYLIHPHSALPYTHWVKLRNVFLNPGNKQRVLTYIMQPALKISVNLLLNQQTSEPSSKEKSVNKPSQTYSSTVEVNVRNKAKHTTVPGCSGGGWMCLLPCSCVLVPGSPIQGDAEDGIQFRERPSKRRQGTLGSVVFLLVILHRFQEDAVLQAVLEVVHHCPLEVLDAARTSQNVALIWVQLEGVVGLHLHQSAQKLRAVLEVDLCFWAYTYTQKMYVNRWK